LDETVVNRWLEKGRLKTIENLVFPFQISSLYLSSVRGCPTARPPARLPAFLPPSYVCMVSFLARQRAKLRNETAAFESINHSWQLRKKAQLHKICMDLSLHVRTV
jgi:hypothetical protein